MSYSDFAIANIRLIILRALADENDYRLNDNLVAMHLESFGHRKPRDSVRDQLRWLEDMGALTLVEAGTALVAEITRRGLDHIERRTIIEGVQRAKPKL